MDRAGELSRASVRTSSILVNAGEGPAIRGSESSSRRSTAAPLASAELRDAPPRIESQRSHTERRDSKHPTAIPLARRAVFISPALRRAYTGGDAQPSRSRDMEHA